MMQMSPWQNRGISKTHFTWNFGETDSYGFDNYTGFWFYNIGAASKALNQSVVLGILNIFFLLMAGNYLLGTVCLEDAGQIWLAIIYWVHCVWKRLAKITEVKVCLYMFLVRVIVGRCIKRILAKGVFYSKSILLPSPEQHISSLCPFFPNKFSLLCSVCYQSLLRWRRTICRVMQILTWMKCNQQ